MSPFPPRAALLAVLACPWLPCTPARAQPAQTIVVTGSRAPLALDRLAADVVVIDAATLRDSGADSLGDLLRREAGVQLSRNGAPGQSTGIFVRGASAQQVVVLVDGVRVGSATLGFAALEALPLAQIDHIEVLRGPGSSLYGADAVGGVVQVFTRVGGGAPHGEFSAALGSYASQAYAASAGAGVGILDIAAGASSEKSRGVSALRPGDPYGSYNPDRDGYHNDAAQLQLGWRPARTQRVGLTLMHSRLDAQYDASEYLAPAYLQDSTPDFRNRQTTDLAALDWRGAVAPGLDGSARVARSADEELSGAHTVARYRTTREQAMAQLAWQVADGGRLVGAIERSVDHATSSDYATSASRTTNGVVGEFSGAARGWAWQADLRRDDSSDFGAVSTGSLGGSVLLQPALRLRVRAGTTFRAPSFNDLYYPGYGVATLRPERGRSVEAGLNWQGADAEASMTVFRNRVRDLIGYQSDATQCPPGAAYQFGCAANTSRALLQGASLAGTRTLAAWTFKAQLDFLAARDVDSGARLARRAAHQGTLGADWRDGRWTLGAQTLLLGGRPDGGGWLAPENTLDVHAFWRASDRWEWQFRLLNATDRRIEPALGYQGLGRQAWLVVRHAVAP